MKKTLIIILCVFLCACMLLSACSSQPAASEAPQSESYSYSGSEGEKSETQAAAEEAVPADPAEDGGLGGLTNAQIPDTDRKLTYTSSFEIHTTQYDSDYNKINAELTAVGGYVENEQTSAYSSDTGKNYGRHSSLILRVPVDQYNAFLDAVSGIGEVVSKEKSAEDITGDYYDTDSRIAVLEERKTRLMEYLKTAATTEDVIALEQEISDVIYELDQLQGTKRRMDNLVDYASVSITLTELITPETIGADGKPLGDRASDAFSMSMSGVGDFMQNFAIFWAAAAPVLIVIAIFVVIILLIIKLVRFIYRKYRAKHPKKQPQPRMPYYPQQQRPPFPQGSQAPVQQPGQVQPGPATPPPDHKDKPEDPSPRT